MGYRFQGLQDTHSMAVVSLKKRSVLSSLVWSNLPKRMFSGLSFPLPPKPGFQARASQAQDTHSMAVVSLKKRSVLSSLVWSNLPKRTFSGLSFPRPPKPGFQARASQAPDTHSMAVVSLKKRSVLSSSSLVWSNLPKRTFSGLSFPRPPKPGFQAGASQDHEVLKPYACYLWLRLRGLEV